jgi:methionyl-tRNA synthetase
VPDDPGQVVYVWFDALANYITALGYGSDEAEYGRWWAGGGRRIHLLGKGVIRFHAVYWPAMLLSAGLPLPSELYVHDYLTADGRKISKSGAVALPGPAALAREYGTDALRWWLLREVPRAGDADFTIERLAARADDELANGIGNLVNRVVSMTGRYRDGRVPAADALSAADAGGFLTALCRDVPGQVDAALADFDFRRATAAVWAIADQANRYISQVRPWELARDPAAASQLDAVLASLYLACRVLARELGPFLPDAAARITAQLTPEAGVLPRPDPVFRRLR